MATEARNQAEAAREANEINRRTLAASVSASVHFTVAEFRTSTDARDEARINIQIPIGNDGGTATRGLRYSAVCAPSVERPADPFDRVRLRSARSYGLTLAPKQTITPIVCSFTVAEWALIGRFRADVYVYGEATYRDTVSPEQVHTVRLCTRLRDTQFTASPFNPGPYAIAEECERHNCRDEECAAQDAALPPRPPQPRGERA